MKSKILVLLSFPFLLSLISFPRLSASEFSRIGLSFDIVESVSGTPGREELRLAVPHLMKRKNTARFRYVGGGDFTLPAYTTEDFLIRYADAEIALSFSWRPAAIQQVSAVQLVYKARLSYPLQPEYAAFERDIIIRPGETRLISDSESPNGKRDTRPLWVLLRCEEKEPVFAFPALGGIGAKLQTRDGYPYVTFVMPASPAQAADIRPEDEIREIDGYSTLQMRLEEATQRMRGEPGSTVRLKLRRSSTGKIEEKAVRRDLKERRDYETP